MDTNKTDPSSTPPTETITITKTTNMGAPIKYNPDDVTTELCRRIINDESVQSICSDPHMPDRDTINRWMHKGRNGDERYKTLYDSILRARREQPYATYDRMIDIERDVMAERINPNAARVALDSMRWRASRMDPKTFGDHKQLEVKGGIDLNIAPVNKQIPAGAEPRKIAADKRKKIG